LRKSAPNSVFSAETLFLGDGLQGWGMRSEGFFPIRLGAPDDLSGWWSGMFEFTWDFVPWKSSVGSGDLAYLFRVGAGVGRHITLGKRAFLLLHSGIGGLLTGTPGSCYTCDGSMGLSVYWMSSADVHFHWFVIGAEGLYDFSGGFSPGIHAGVALNL
jgi:hypothetical protein